jgi:NUMOD3 motif
MTVVYWLFDAACTDPWSHGYVGVTVDLPNRMKWHRAKRGVFECRVLFEGTDTECYALEAAMRPDAFMGWNQALGGECGGGRHPRSVETRERMRQASFHRYADQRERDKMRELMIGRKITWGKKISVRKQGVKNPKVAEANRAMIVTDEARAKMSASRKGKARRTFTVEHRANISAAQKRRWEKEVPQCPEDFCSGSFGSSVC